MQNINSKRNELLQLKDSAGNYVINSLSVSTPELMEALLAWHEAEVVKAVDNKMAELCATKIDKTIEELQKAYYRVKQRESRARKVRSGKGR